MDLEVLHDCDDHIEFLEIEGGGALAVPFAINHEIPCVYSLVVMLSPYDEGMHEFSFSIVQQVEGNDKEIEYQSGKKTKNLLNDEARSLCLALLLLLTQKLLSVYKPRKVFRCTFDVNPPQKAIEKHHIVNQAFHVSGYTITRTDPWYGRRTWVCELIDASVDSR